MRLRSQYLGIILLFASHVAHAWVDETNANFVLSRIDHRVSDPGSPVQLLLQRTYNSVSVSNGLFGRGWCSTFETSLVAVSPNSVVVQECGDGRAAVFTMGELSSKLQSEATEKILAAAKLKLGDVPADFKKVLETDSVFRARIVRLTGVEFAIADASSFVSLNGDRISFADGRWTRKHKSGGEEVFNKLGLLQSVSSGGAKISFDYDKGLLRSMTDGRGRRLFIGRDTLGHIAQITAPKGAVTKYNYSVAGDLIKVKSEAGIEEYAYDDDHNMTMAKTGDAVVNLKYDVANDRVSEIAYGKCRETFDYEVKAGGADKFAVTHSQSCAGSTKTKTRAEYQYSNRADGLSAKMQDIVIDASGAKTETRFDERGRMISRHGPKTNADLTYSKDGKLTLFESGPTTFSYTYTAGGLLSEAKVGADTKIAYTFDAKGRLVKLRDGRGRVVELDYVANSMRAESVFLPGQIKVPLKTGGPSLARSPASLQDMAATLALYDELYTPAIPALLGARNAK